MEWHLCPALHVVGRGSVAAVREGRERCLAENVPLYIANISAMHGAEERCGKMRPGQDDFLLCPSQMI